MNVKRFHARTSRDALALVKQAFGDDAVVLSTKPAGDGVEVLAMAPDGMQQIERMAAAVPPAPARGAAAPAQPPAADGGVAADVERLSMSTLSFQDYVRERMLKRRQAAIQPAAEPVAAAAAPAAVAPAAAMPTMPAMPAATLAPSHALPPEAPRAAPTPADLPLLHDSLAWTDEAPLPAASHAAAQHHAAAAARREQQDMMNELRSMKGLIEERFGALAFMEKLQRQPAQARLTQKLLDAGFSPALIRKLVEGMDASVGDELAWAGGVLERNLLTNEHDGALEEHGGVYALIGSTGVGKTTSTAKIAAAFATRHGATNLGLITLDAYRVAAHEQLRAYGRILGVPVHTAHDRATLEDLLELLSAKKMVLIDTAGIGQRDQRTRDLLDMLSHRSINKLLVVNAAAQGETIEDVMLAYRASACAGVVVSKMDEAMKLGPALDAVIRHRMKVVGVANGQRVPEDWHRLSAKALVHRALRAAPGAAWRMDAGDVSLMFAGTPRHAVPAASAAATRA
jgi:flagellar biosynthesis protein FlhF